MHMVHLTVSFYHITYTFQSECVNTQSNVTAQSFGQFLYMTECSFMNLVVADSNPAEVMKDDMLALVCDLDRDLQDLELRSTMLSCALEVTLGSLIFLRQQMSEQGQDIRNKCYFQRNQIPSKKSCIVVLICSYGKLKIQSMTNTIVLSLTKRSTFCKILVTKFNL